MKIAKVVANPYAALDVRVTDDDDKVGIPQGAVALPASRGIYLGARLDPVASQRTGKNKFYFPLDKDGKRRVLEIQVDDANVRAHISRAILDGSLIAADARTAKLVGLSDKEFLSVDAALAAEKARALDSLQALYGKSSTLADVPVDPEAEPSDEEAKPAPTRGRGIAFGKALTLESQEGK